MTAPASLPPRKRELEPSAAAGDTPSTMSAPLRSPPLPADYRPPVVYADSGGLLIVDKPFDVRVDGDFDVTIEKMVRKLPSAEEEKPTEHNMSKKQHKGYVPPPVTDITEELALPVEMDKFRLVNQLDFATSGLLVLATNYLADRLASRLFMQRRTCKWYLAVGQGKSSRPVGSAFVLEKAIRPVPGDFRMECVSETETEGKIAPSATLFVPLIHTELSHSPTAEEVTVFALRPLSGRRHQLRLHMKAAGHPIIGDYTYHTREPSQVPRMLLHAWRLLLRFSEDERPPGEVSVQANPDFCGFLGCSEADLQLAIDMYVPSVHSFDTLVEGIDV